MALTGTKTDWLSDRALRGLIAGALRLPWERRVALMGSLSRRVIAPVAGWRTRALANLEHVRPDLASSQRRLVADQCADNMGRTLIENYANAEFARRLATTEAKGDGLAAIAEAKAAGRPVLFVTGHFGNYEAPRHVLARMGYEVGGIYKAMQNPYFNDHYARTMAEVSGPVFRRGKRGTMGFARHLRGGGMATILFDIYEKHGALLPFLGQPAPTTTSPADLALRFDALMVPYFGRRRADGFGFDVFVEAPVPHGPPLQMMAEANRRLEARIVADPGQWFWIHRRWKPERLGRAQPAD